MDELGAPEGFGGRRNVERSRPCGGVGGWVHDALGLQDGVHGMIGLIYEQEASDGWARGVKDSCQWRYAGGVRGDGVADRYGPLDDSRAGGRAERHGGGSAGGGPAREGPVVVQWRRRHDFRRLGG